jgi:hypothetical protein
MFTRCFHYLNIEIFQIFLGFGKNYSSNCFYCIFIRNRFNGYSSNSCSSFHVRYILSQNISEFINYQINLDNWLNEIESWCTSINYIVYSGSQDERRIIRYELRENKYEKPINVLITTYSLISSTSEDKSFFGKFKFDYCVFDEAHMLKNMTTIRYQNLIKISVHK